MNHDGSNLISIKREFERELKSRTDEWLDELKDDITHGQSDQSRDIIDSLSHGELFKICKAINIQNFFDRWYKIQEQNEIPMAVQYMPDTRQDTTIELQRVAGRIRSEISKLNRVFTSGNRSIELCVDCRLSDDSNDVGICLVVDSYRYINNLKSYIHGDFPEKDQHSVLIEWANKIGLFEPIENEKKLGKFVRHCLGQGRDVSIADMPKIRNKQLRNYFIKEMKLTNSVSYTHIGVIGGGKREETIYQLIGSTDNPVIDVSKPIIKLN